MQRAARIDRNQPEIVKALRKVGATVLITSQLKNAFDILVGYQGKTFIVEIKDGLRYPSHRKLKEGEQQCKYNFERVGVKYWVIESIEDALNMINETNDR